ncbi:hypothetical protein C5167_038449 [Papaver somniferum]|uniref:Uncharacterized protein n=1 Tax=Papaver somniferum TaxID=3469 RepID=A0A4Y7IBU1_PAPSO|nr:uncharacterized protein LOC113348883 [Papaver somniferum]RZC45496.1 hypothetical protein C5167_038449 [Papaver somniferum]
MGVCASSETTRRRPSGGGIMSSESTAKVIHTDGRLQEFKQPIRAEHILSQNPNCFLCSSETMYVDMIIPKMDETEELQMGQVYFLLPLSHSRQPLTISELCALAIKASSVLPRPKLDLISVHKSGGNKIPAIYANVKLGSRVNRGNLRGKNS